MTQPKRPSNRRLQWDEAARVYEALGKADPDLVPAFVCKLAVCKPDLYRGQR